VSIIFTDDQIRALILEPKPLPPDYRRRLRLRQKRGHREQELSVQGAEGHEFHIILRQSSIDPLNFSVILSMTGPGTNRIFRLRRYNSKTHQHSNRLEGSDRFYSFHIHQATERYQEAGWDEDSYAEPTERFADLHGAIKCMFQDCGFILPEAEQLILFEES
jgi:hypothetical protein